MQGVHRVSILGVGLLGGSLGLALRTLLSGVEITGYGHRRGPLEQALGRGAIDRIAGDLPEAANADLLILCTPVGVVEELLAALAPHLPDRAIVTDVGSTKASIVRAAGRLLRRPGRFVGSHPMAGSEKRGVEHACPDLFRGATAIVTPTAAADPDAVERVESLWRTLEMSLVRLAPEAHDRLVARVSHLPHALASALVRLQTNDSARLAGRGFADMTRIAGGDPRLWRDILIDNAPAVLASLEDLRAALDPLADALRRGDASAVERWLADAASRRRGCGDPRGGGD